MGHKKQVKDYISKNYKDWDINELRNNGDSVEISDNGDVHYNGYTIIKTGIRK
jgi:hypothetical protein